MSTSQNKAVVRRFWEYGYNNCNLYLVDELFAPDYIHHSNDTPLDRAAFRSAAEGFQMSFPDSRVMIERLIGEQDLVVVRSRFTGTHTVETEMWETRRAGSCPSRPPGSANSPTARSTRTGRPGTPSR